MKQRQEKVLPQWSSPPSRVWRCVSYRAPLLPLPKHSMGCWKAEHSYQSLSPPTGAVASILISRPSSSLSPVSVSVRHHPHSPVSISQPVVPIQPLPSIFSIVLATFWLPYHNLPKVISRLYTGYLCMIYCIYHRLTLRSRTYFFWMKHLAESCIAILQIRVAAKPFTAQDYAQYFSHIFKFKFVISCWTQ